MFKQLREMIPRRRSVRSYEERAVEEQVLAQMNSFMQNLRPLIDGALPVARVIPTREAAFLQKWRNPQFLAFYAPNTQEGLMNVGFMYQQLDLYLQSLGLGTCWVGLGTPVDTIHKPPEGMKLAVMMAFGYPADVPERAQAADFTRRSMQHMTDRDDARLEPVRLAPSATNSQPWFFLHEGDVLHVYREKLSLIRQRTHGRMNAIDMGIALAHLYVTHPESFRFGQRTEHPDKTAYTYVGSVTL